MPGKLLIERDHVEFQDRAPLLARQEIAEA
jgi:hypothetical protein